MAMLTKEDIEALKTCIRAEARECGGETYITKRARAALAKLSPSAEVDEARYRYIRSEGTKLHPQILSVTFNAGHDWEHKYSHTDFDAVIDAARARSAKGE